MLNDAFLWILSRGIELGIIVLCLLPFRVLLRKKAARKFSYLLWSALPINLIYNLCVLLMPKLNYWIGNSVYDAQQVVVDEIALQIMKYLWICGTVVVVSVMVYSYIQFLRRLVGSIRMQGNIYQAEHISSPFSLGVLSPKIFLPMSLKEEYFEFVILHEQVHIARKDIWMKYIAIAVLAVFWFQPLLWPAYSLFINDMEEACDEAVIRNRDDGFRTEYARAIIEVTYQTGKLWGTPVGYGSGKLKERIRHVMHYKKGSPVLWFAAVLGCILFIGSTVLISWQAPRVVQVECDNQTYGRPALFVEESGAAEYPQEANK